MSTAILTLAFPTLGLIMALVLYDLVRREQRRIRVLRHKLQLRSIRDEVLRLAAQGRLGPSGTGPSALVSTIDVVLDASEDLGVELVPPVVRLLDDESVRGAELERLREAIVREILAIVEHNSRIASLAFAWARQGGGDRGNRAARVHALAGALTNLAP